MDLRPLASQQDLELASRWLRQNEINKWLDVQTPSGPPTPLMLKAMCQRGAHLLRLFAVYPDAPAVGLIGLSSVHPTFHTGMLWYALGEPAHANKGLTTNAVAAFVRYAFQERGIEAINAWVVETNSPSIRVLEKNGFRYIGRQRHCHYIDGHPHDRLLYDLLACEQPSEER